jgi:hypothetical protein
MSSNTMTRRAALLACLFMLPATATRAETLPRSFSGIYPHLAMFNDERECGTGAVVPFAGRLWVVTYGSHHPAGSSDKLYEIDERLNMTIRPESIGGTPANRMIHRESNQLFIGPYAIDATRNVRPIPYTRMFGRHTATMRHRADPANKVYYATMEEGFYEIDVNTLDVRELFPDGNRAKDANGAAADLGGSLLPGYHGKGAYTGHGRVVYANNGERGEAALRNPATPSGALATWNGQLGKDGWTVVRRNQFTDVTGPGGIDGNARPDTDPIWSIGWDHRSLILMMLDDVEGRPTWQTFRLPKGSHAYDGAHGWNTEWPRIREIGEGDDLLMTMHGAFWRFPRTFAAGNTAGIAPRSNYLKVVGDFARWGDKLVLGCDDTARSEFLNKRAAKGKLAGPGQSHSNLWFIDPSALDTFGPPIGRGGVWVNDDVVADAPSDPFLFAGYDRRALHLAHRSTGAVTFDLEVDERGDGMWSRVESIKVLPSDPSWVDLTETMQGQWVRLVARADAKQVTGWFQYAVTDRRPNEADAIFNGVAGASDARYTGGLVRVQGDNTRSLQLIAQSVDGTNVADIGNYELAADMKLTRVDDARAETWLKENAAIPRGVLAFDEASVIYVDDAGRRWRLPRGEAGFDALSNAGLIRIDREVVTERDLFNAGGTFYELPADNAGGFAKVRPIATHNRRIMDYASYRGLLILTGIVATAPAGNAHIIRSDDGKAALWAGAVDDLWKLGKPRGRGGPWKDSAVKADVASDPFLMTGYDSKSLTLSHGSDQPVKIALEIDMTGDGNWVTFKSIAVPPGQTVKHVFPPSFQAYWLRTTADRDCTATAWLVYE